MERKIFKMLVSFAGRMQNVSILASDVISAMEQVRSSSSEPVCLVKYEMVG